MQVTLLRVLLVWAMNAFLGGSAMAQAGDSYKLGQKLNGSLTLGKEGMFGSTVRTIPLPAGEWTVLDGSTSNNILQTASVVLVQHDAGRISAALFIYANTVRASGRQFNNLCMRPDSAYQNKYSSGTWDQRCLEVRHDVGMFAQAPGSGNKLKDATVKLGLSAEPVMVWMSYTQIDQKMNILQYEYLVDAGKFEIDTPRTSYQDSPWHKDRISGDKLRSSFMKQFIAYSETLSDSLKEAFEFKPPIAVPAPAFTFKE